jgi:hypothetical protein
MELGDLTGNRPRPVVGWARLAESLARRFEDEDEHEEEEEWDFQVISRFNP